MARENGKTKRGGRRGRGACRGISPIPVATSVNRVYRIPDRPINWLTDPPCIMQPRRVELFFSRCSRASEPELFRAHAHTHTHIHLLPPAATRGSHCEYYYPGAADLCTVFSPSHPHQPRLIVLSRCTDYAVAHLYTAWPTNSPIILQ